MSKKLKTYGILFSFVIALIPSISFAAPATPVIEKIVSTSAAGSLVNEASVELSGTKPVGRISYTVTATPKLPNDKITVLPSDSATSWNIPVTGLTAGVQYLFVVTAAFISDPANSSSSEFKDFTPQSVPDAPTGSIAEAGQESVKLVWSPPANIRGSALTGFTITDGAKTYTAASTDTTTTILNLTQRTKYTFTITADNAIGSSSVATFNEVSVTGKPSAPGKPTIVLDGSNLKVTWTAPTDAGLGTVGFYRVTATPTSGTPLTKDITGATTATFTSIPSNTWTATVIANNGFYYSDASTASDPLTTLASQTIDFAEIGAQSYPGSLTVSATATSGLTVTFSASGNCTLSNLRTVTFTSGGSCTVTASQAGNTTYNPATSVERTFAISGGGGGGGFGGGGGGGGDAPPSPPPTPIAVPSFSPDQKVPTPVETPTPVSSSKPVPTPAPSASSSAGNSKPKTSSYFQLTDTGAKPSVKVKITSNNQTIVAKKSKTIQITLPNIPKGVTFKSTVKTPDGKTFTLKSTKTKKAGDITIPTVSFKKAGTYKILVTYGKVTKTITIKISEEPKKATPVKKPTAPTPTPSAKKSKATVLSIVCTNGKTTKTVKGTAPTCPSGFNRK
ncbi:unannotated protein [freshwater metagenome]|uniref:Unannotated protein n=1 Tax=freshwater metagenome TaxID=449393 RepID=A0A6J6TVR5_9ZZZZ|nr:hypothetical protein [Actinomycetota bacterium]